MFLKRKLSRYNYLVGETEQKQSKNYAQDSLFQIQDL